ncbi:MAG: hypothetical protein AAB917_01585 [Patescibacteria group bacterium]
METKFQTSFIPKRPLVGGEKPRSSSGVSIFMVLAVIIFVVSLAGAGFTFVWKDLLMDQQAEYQLDLKEREKRFGIADIERLKKKDLKIDFAIKILSNHLSVSEIFDIIAGLTIDGVHFSSLDYVGPDITNGQNDQFAKITMKGLANSFSSIAWQSDVFGRSQKYGTNKILKDPVLSDLSVDLAGNVGFVFSANINPTDISYEKVLQGDQTVEDPDILTATSTEN